MSESSFPYDLAVSGVRSLVPYQAGKPVSELQREMGLQQIVKLASNENPLGPSPKAVAAMHKIMPELARYPDGSGFELKQILAEKLNIKNEQITLGNGSNEILELLARTFLTAAHEVVFSQHAFAVYPLVTQAVGATARIAPAKNYGHDLSAMQERINDKTRLVFIANPNNPTGTYLNAAGLEAFIRQLPKNVLCVLDEAYYEYVDVPDYPQTLNWLDKYPNLIITRTFSKAYGLAGLRIGYSLSSPEIADLLNRVRQPFNNNALALVAAQAALQDVDYLQRSLDNNKQGMAFLCSAFSEMNLQWIPSVANFISLDVQQDGLALYQRLLARGVIVRPVANYEMPTHLRISIGSESENRFFVDALKSVLHHVQ